MDEHEQEQERAEQDDKERTDPTQGRARGSEPSEDPTAGPPERDTCGDPTRGAS